jgi:hypothetical protein
MAAPKVALAAPFPALFNLQEVTVPDKKLTILVSTVILLLLGHDFDHFVRGDFGWQLTARTVPVIAILVTQFALLGFGLFLYLRNKVGPLFWAFVAGIGAAVGFLAHFSPFSDQTPQAIYRAYATPAAGALAVLVLALLMLSLIATAAYAQYLWAKGPTEAKKAWLP